MQDATDLDKRHAPFSCLVQVKCIKLSRDQIRLRLSSLEQIAKDLKPSFIYIFRLDDRGEFGDSVIIHLYDKVLEKILKKLRSEEAAGRTAVNNAFINLSMSNGTELRPTGQAFREFLAEECGSDPVRYVTDKAAALKQLGYEGKPFEVNMNLTIASEDEYIDVMLGLKADVPAEITSHRETRFGITLEKEDLSNVSGSLTVRPGSLIKSRLVVRRDRFSDPVVFRGEINIAPSLANTKKIGGLYFRSRLLNLTAKMFEERFSLSIKAIEIEDTTSLSPEEWIEFFRLSQAISQDGFSLSIEPEHMKPLNLPNARAMLAIDEEIVAFDIENAKRLKRLAEMAGALDTTEILFGQLCQQADSISAGFALLNGERSSEMSFKLAKQDGLTELPDNIEGMHVNFVQCKDDIIAWSANVNLRRKVEDSSIKFVSEAVVLEEVRKMDVGSYPAFVDEVRDKVGGGVLMARNLSV